MNLKSKLFIKIKTAAVNCYSANNKNYPSFYIRNFLNSNHALYLYYFVINYPN